MRQKYNEFAKNGRKSPQKKKTQLPEMAVALSKVTPVGLEPTTH